MKNYHQLSGLNIGLDFLVSTDWTPVQAWAVVELLDDLCDRIMSYYRIPIQELLREEYGVAEATQEELTNWNDLTF